MSPRVCLVTGATSGIGLEIASELARRGARVLIAGPDDEQALRAREVVHARAPAAELLAYGADLSSMTGVRELARRVHADHARLDVLVNNAGVYLPRRRLTDDGYEATLAVNGLAPFLLAALLADALRRSDCPRVVNTASIAHHGGRMDFDDPHFSRRRYHGFFAYAASKLALVWFTRELARREGERVLSVAAHPGIVATALVRNTGLFARLFGWAMPLLRSPEHGARTPVSLAADRAPAQPNGGYFVDGRPRPVSAAARDPALAQRWWALAEELTGVRWG